VIESFNPFSDRLSRDIRNSLSAAFVRSVAAMDPSEVIECVHRRLQDDLDPAHLAYIEDRSRRYDEVFASFRTHGVHDLLQQSLYMWNGRLFFEFHEHIEGLWRKARRKDRRRGLQGLILAAGAYEHLAYQRTTSAERLAEKAADLLNRYGNAIRFCENAGALIAALRRIDPDPPLLILR
jgi:hypothetical protein